MKKIGPPVRSDDSARGALSASGDEEGYRLRVLAPVVALSLAAALGILFLVRSLTRAPPAPAHATEAAEKGAPAEPVERGVVAAGPAGSASPGLVALRTSEAILDARGKGCLDCARQNNCLDGNQEGATCANASGLANGCGPGVTEEDMCLATLAKVFSSQCAATLQEVPCLCGAVDVVGCLQGTVAPAGPLYRDYACDFGTSDPVAIQERFRDGRYGAGMANTIIQCVAGYACPCFAN
jgi:hypothetical protein